MNSDRRHELDWLRLLAIVLLQVFHTGMLFVPWEWHVKAPTTVEWLQVPMIWLHFWRMPLLLVISGAGTWFALGRRTPRQYVGERARRLLIPLVFGIFVIVPPQIYFERIDQYASYAEFWPTVLRFVPYPLGGSFSWHHLWFVLYLFLFSVLALPFFMHLRGERSLGLRDRLVRLVSRRGGFAWFLVPLVGSQFALRPIFHDFSTGALIDDGAAFVWYLLFFVAGFLCVRDPRLWRLLGERRRQHLVIAVLVLVPFYLAYFIPYGVHFFRYDFVYGIPSAVMAWYTVLAAMGYGQRYLSRPSRVTTYANEALYPFYILHQTAIIFVGYYVVQWSLPWPVAYLVVFVTSGALSLGVYHWLIRPFALLRVLHGMKARPRRVCSGPLSTSGAKLTIRATDGLGSA